MGHNHTLGARISQGRVVTVALMQSRLCERCVRRCLVVDVQIWRERSPVCFMIVMKGVIASALPLVQYCSLTQAAFPCELDRGDSLATDGPSSRHGCLATRYERAKRKNRPRVGHAGATSVQSLQGYGQLPYCTTVLVSIVWVPVFGVGQKAKKKKGRFS